MEKVIHLVCVVCTLCYNQPLSLPVFSSWKKTDKLAQLIHMHQPAIYCTKVNASCVCHPISHFVNPHGSFEGHINVFLPVLDLLKILFLRKNCKDIYIFLVQSCSDGYILDAIRLWLLDTSPLTKQQEAKINVSQFSTNPLRQERMTSILKDGVRFHALLTHESALRSSLEATAKEACTVAEEVLRKVTETFPWHGAVGWKSFHFYGSPRRFTVS